MLHLICGKKFGLALLAIGFLNSVKSSELDEELSTINNLNSYKYLFAQPSYLARYEYPNFFQPYPKSLKSLYNQQPGISIYGSPDLLQNPELLSGIGKTAVVAAAGTKTVVGGALAAILLAAAGKAALLSAVGKTALESALEKERLGHLRNLGGQGYFPQISYPLILDPYFNHQNIYEYGFDPILLGKELYGYKPHSHLSHGHKLDGQGWGKTELTHDHNRQEIYGYLKDFGHGTRGNPLHEYYGINNHGHMLHRQNIKNYYGYGYGNNGSGKIGALEHLVKKTTKGVVRAAFSELREM